MKLKKESIETKNSAMVTKSDLQHEDDSLENTSAVFSNQAIADGSQLNKMSAEQMVPNFKEEVVVKEEIFESHLVDESILQNAYSESEDCIVISAKESISSESQKYKIPSEESILASKEEEIDKQEHFEVFLVEESILQNTYTKSEDCIIIPTSKSTTSKSQECKIASKENILASEEEQVIKLDKSDVSMTDVSKLLDESHQHEVPSKENLSDVKEPNKIFNFGDSKSHREKMHYSSESSDYETDSSSSWDEFYDKLHKNVVPSQLPTLKTKGELLIEDLPPVEDLDLNVDATELQKIGNVLHNVISKERNEYLVVVASDGNSNPVDEDSVLFLSSDNPLGKIYDVFGSVSKPNYTVRFNKAEDIYDKGVAEGQDVYYLPENNELTHYVLVDVLKQQKGSDASWKDNNEPPDDQIDYSDDEQEKLAKQKRRAKNRRNDRNWNDGEREDMTPNKMEKKHANYNQERTFLARPTRSKFRSPTASISGSSPLSYSSSHRFDRTPPPSNIVGPQRNAISSQPFGFTSSNNRLAFPLRPFMQSNIPAPQAFGPFTQSNVPSPQPLGTFPQSSVPSYQPFTVPPTSNVLVSFNFSSSFATGALQQNPSIMAAPQNNVPLQQQLILQSPQAITSFLSRPPPNYNCNQNIRPFLHHNQSFAPPIFGAPPAVRPTLQNVPNQSPANQIPFPFGTHCPPNSLSGNLNISPPRNITSVNSNGHLGQSGSIVQSNSANSFIFPQFSSTNTQHNNVYHQITQPVFVPNQPSPCPTPPFVPCQTPPPTIFNQQGLSNPHPIVLPSQTPPPTIHPFAFTLPVARSPMPPQSYPFS